MVLLKELLRVVLRISKAFKNEYVFTRTKTEKLKPYNKNMTNILKKNKTQHKTRKILLKA